jgi:hypothetical protein
VKHILMYSLLIIRKLGCIGSLYGATTCYPMNHSVMSVLGKFLQWLSKASHPACVPFLANLKLLFHSSCLLRGFVKCARAKPRLCLVRVCFVCIQYSRLRFHQAAIDGIIHSVRQQLHSAVEDWVI